MIFKRTTALDTPGGDEVIFLKMEIKDQVSAVLILPKGIMVGFDPEEEEIHLHPLVMDEVATIQLTTNLQGEWLQATLGQHIDVKPNNSFYVTADSDVIIYFPSAPQGNPDITNKIENWDGRTQPTIQ